MERQAFDEVLAEAVVVAELVAALVVESVAALVARLVEGSVGGMWSVPVPVLPRAVAVKERRRLLLATEQAAATAE